MFITNDDLTRAGTGCFYPVGAIGLIFARVMDRSTEVNFLTHSLVEYVMNSLID